MDYAAKHVNLHRRRAVSVTMTLWGWRGARCRTPSTVPGWSVTGGPDGRRRPRGRYRKIFGAEVGGKLRVVISIAKCGQVPPGSLRGGLRHRRRSGSGGARACAIKPSHHGHPPGAVARRKPPKSVRGLAGDGRQNMLVSPGHASTWLASRRRREASVSRTSGDEFRTFHELVLATVPHRAPDFVKDSGQGQRECTGDLRTNAVAGKDGVSAAPATRAPR